MACIIHGCGAPASRAARHTTVCLDFQEENDQRLRHTCAEHQGDPKAKHDVQQKLRYRDAGCRGAHAKYGHQTGQMQKGKYIKRGNNGNKRIPSHKLRAIMKL